VAISVDHWIPPNHSATSSSWRNRTLAAHGLWQCGVAHLWYAWLNQPQRRVHRLWLTLSPDECAQAMQFATRQAVERYIVGRGLLKVILARYLQIRPAQVSIVATVGGKPQLLGAAQHISFNMAHSRSLVVYAVACGYEIGVDVEHRAVVEQTERDVMYDGFLCDQEAVLLRRLHPSRHSEWFLRFWTRKEAYAKGTGRGISPAFARMDTSRARHVRLLTQDGPLANAEPWTLLGFAPTPRYIATVAIADEGWQLASRKRVRCARGIPAPQGVYLSKIATRSRLGGVTNDSLR